MKTWAADIIYNSLPRRPTTAPTPHIQHVYEMINEHNFGNIRANAESLYLRFFIFRPKIIVIIKCTDDVIRIYRFPFWYFSVFIFPVR